MSSNPTLTDEQLAARVTLEEVTHLAYTMRAEHPGWREGQCFFNALHTLRPDLANKIRGTRMDPFHDTTVTVEFFGFVNDALEADR